VPLLSSIAIVRFKLNTSVLARFRRHNTTMLCSGDSFLQLSGEGRPRTASCEGSISMCSEKMEGLFLTEHSHICSLQHIPDLHTSLSIFEHIPCLFRHIHLKTLPVAVRT
jgi:hypothetical protein